MKKLDQTTIDNLRTMIRMWYWADEESHIECNMGAYNLNGDGGSTDPKHLCGSVCCGLGVAPLTIPIYLSDYRDEEFVYIYYSNRVFPALGSWEDANWAWVFSEKWRGVDDTFRGVALRAQYLLDNWGKVTLKVVNANVLGRRNYMFYKDNHSRTIPYLEAEREKDIK